MVSLSKRPSILLLEEAAYAGEVSPHRSRNLCRLHLPADILQGPGVLPTRHTDVKTPNLMTGKCLALAYKQL